MLVRLSTFKLGSPQEVYWEGFENFVLSSNIAFGKMRDNDKEMYAGDNVTFGETPIIKLRQTSKKIIKNVTIEPLLAIHAFAYGLVCIIVPSVYFDKICRVLFRVLA